MASVGSPVGWATQNGGTTGGAAGSTVTVTTSSALDTVSPVEQRHDHPGLRHDLVRPACTRSPRTRPIQGVGSSSGITGGGLNCPRVSNVIIRNMIFKNADDDAINVQYSTNVWIDHNDLSNGYDGLVDIKRASDYVTVSWNHVHDHDKDMLLGHDDDNASEDTGHLRVTYHHNWFDGTTQRNPRVRFGNPVHVYNNYFNDNSGYGVAATCERRRAASRATTSRTSTDPYHLAEGDSPDGNLVAKNNYMVNSGAPETTGGNVARSPTPTPSDAASTVKSIVTAGAGVGKSVCNLTVPDQGGSALDVVRQPTRRRVLPPRDAGLSAAWASAGQPNSSLGSERGSRVSSGGPTLASRR